MNAPLWPLHFSLSVSASFTQHAIEMFIAERRRVRVSEQICVA